MRSGALRYGEPLLVAVGVVAAYLLLQPETGDHAAQVFRAWLFENEGLAAWSNLWFGGHHLPGYSLLFPPLAAAVGARELGALAMVVSAVLFAAIAYRRWGERARWGVIWFAAAIGVTLFIGRLSFALGVPIALGAVLAAQRGHRWTAIALAGLCPLASPVVGLFLASAGIAYSLAERRREGLELAGAAAGVAVLVTLAFPEGGTQPFSAASFWPALVIAVVAFVATPREERLLGWGIACYGAILIGSFLIDSPMGSNALRMGSLLLGPLLACALWRHQRRVLLVLAPLILVWQVVPVVRELHEVRAQASVRDDYYAPLRGYLRSAAGGDQQRVEVVPANNHWEAAYVPRGIYIARGWERQLDEKLNPLFYEEDEPLTAARYRRWLDDLAVGFVAVPDAPLDFAGEAEAALIARGVSYLELAYRGENWRVYRVDDPTPLATGAATLGQLTAQAFVLDAKATGTALVRVRWTPYWAVTEGYGCVEESPGGFTRVSIERPGRLSVGVRFAPWRVGDDGPVCSHQVPEEVPGA